MRDKLAIREGVWTALEQAGVVRSQSVHDKIPDFYGAEAAAERVFDLAAWQAARVVKSNPDKAQRPLRERALAEGKLLYMAVPRLAQERCFVELDPAVMGCTPAQASTIGGAFQYGRPVYAAELRPVDLVISGSVAVNREGVRVGKGGGYADLEYGLAAAAGVIRPETPVVTTVHPWQVLTEPLPRAAYDVPLNYIATPEEMICCPGDLPRPGGIYWAALTAEKVAAIPALGKLRG